MRNWLSIKLQVEQLFAEADKEIAAFRKQSGLYCLPGCGKCCTYPDVEATVLEFIPLAWHLHETGEADKLWLVTKTKPDSVCVMFTELGRPGKGQCSDYLYRGMICRLFGYAAVRDKYGKPRLSTCKIIKESQAEAVETVKREDIEAPLFSRYYSRLEAIDWELASRFLPVNKAIREALSYILQYKAYESLNSEGDELGVC